jgi:hypothetical protein
MIDELYRCRAPVEKITKSKLLSSYRVGKTFTAFTVEGITYTFGAMLPPDAFYGLATTLSLLRALHIKPDPTFSRFQMPPGRGLVFSGKKGSTIIDSCYNANLSSMINVLELFRLYPGSPKWMVLGDMLEQGREEKEEHERLASVAAKAGAERIILMGPRVIQYTYPLLASLVSKNVVLAAYETPPEVLSYLEENITGGETILFKGARFLEGVIEHLLADKKDAARLARREIIWQIRRKKWGL